jgi:hypothetical protein
MTQLRKANTVTKYNDSGSGLFKTNSAGEIEAVDVQALVTDITDSVPFTLDDEYSWAKGNRAGITAPASLKDIVTVGKSFGIQITFTDTTASNVLRTYELTNETTAESSPTVIRPNDYAGTTNEKVWRLRAVASTTAGVSAAEDVTFTPAGGIAATDVQAAIEELDTEKASTGSVSTVATDLSNHIADTSAAHAASAIANTPAGGIAATDVQAALNELDTEKMSSVAVVNTFTADHILALTDVGGGANGMFGHVRMNLTGTANNVTVPPNSTAAFQVGTEIGIVQVGTGVTTVVQGVGVTVTSSTGSLVSPGQNQPMVLKKISTNGWELYNGNVGAALTKTDDTNVTLTLGGAASTALLGASSLTLGWNGTLSATRGGTGVSNVTQTYTPTLTNVANVAASTAQVCQYFRVGNMVTVCGQLSIDPTTTATLTTLGISLPIASNFTTAFQAGGTAAATAVADAVAGIISDATNDRATLQYVCTDVTNHVMAFTFTYQVL